MGGHWHDATAASQNVGNHIGDRSSVRQSKLYRRYESGNQMKSLLGQGSLQWDENKQQGAYSGPVYDHNKAQYTKIGEQRPQPSQQAQQKQLLDQQAYDERSAQLQYSIDRGDYDQGAYSVGAGPAMAMGGYMPQQAPQPLATNYGRGRGSRKSLEVEVTGQNDRLGDTSSTVDTYVESMKRVVLMRHSSSGV